LKIRLELLDLILIITDIFSHHPIENRIKTDEFQSHRDTLNKYPTIGSHEISHYS